MRNPGPSRMSEGPARHSYFIDHTFQRRGQTLRSLQWNDPSLGLLERAQSSHLNAILWGLRPHTRDRCWIVLADTDVPMAELFVKERDGIAEIRVSRGTLALLSILAARAAVTIGERKFLSGLMPSYAAGSGIVAEKERFGDFDGFAPFSLPEDWQAATACLDQTELANLTDELRKDRETLARAMRLAAAAGEFLVLHEMGHVDAGHDQVPEVLRARRDDPESSLDMIGWRLAHGRYMEHQADIFALRLQIHFSSLRPADFLFREMQAPPGDLRNENNYAAYVGAALNLALVTLLRAERPPKGEDVLLQRRLRAEHPLPTTRLRVADAVVRSEFQNPDVREMGWPEAPEMLDAIQQSVALWAMQLALSTITCKWRTAVDSFAEGEMNPSLEFVLPGSEEDLAQSLEELDGPVVTSVQTVLNATGYYEGDRRGGLARGPAPEVPRRNRD